MHVEQGALRPERGHVGGALVAYVELDAGLRRHHHLFHDNRGDCAEAGVTNAAARTAASQYDDPMIVLPMIRYRACP